MKILFINHHGGGFAAEIEIADRLTVSELFEERMQHESPEDYLIRVNRQYAPADQILRAGDRVSFTPRKIEGATY